MEKEIKQRWESKRESVYNLRYNIDRLKRRVKQDLFSPNEKDRLTALVVSKTPFCAVGLELLHTNLKNKQNDKDRRKVC